MMHKLQRNDPCPCGSGKKVKKCCPELLLKPSPSAVPTQGETQYRSFLTSKEAMPTPKGVKSWPIVRSFVPVLDVWRATGLGTAGIVRQQPDGRYAWAFFVIELLEHGLKSTFGKYDVAKEEVGKMLGNLSGTIPPMEEGIPEVAAQFIWGAHALADAEGYGFPPDELAPYFALIQRPPGSSRQWLDRLVGRGGLTPAELLRVVRANRIQDDVPDGKEVVIVTTMTFELTDKAAAIEVLRRAEPDFLCEGIDGDAEVFQCTRECPKRYRHRLSRLGGRQHLGTVRVDDCTLVAEAQTLSLAARLNQRLLQLLNGGITLRATGWYSMNDMLARSEEAQITAGPHRSLPERHQ